MKSSVNQKNKSVVWEFWRLLDQVGTFPDSISSVQRYAADDVQWFGHDPVNRLSGLKSFFAGFWQPLRRAFPDLKRHTHMFFGGQSNGRIDGDASLDGRWWITGTGYLTGTFSSDYLGIRASGRATNIRWGEFCRLMDGRITEIYFLLDMVDLIQQAGLSVLPPSRGRDGFYPPPDGNDGLLMFATDERESAHSLTHLRRFIFDGLNRYDQSSLKSMGIAGYFDPQIRWYGPGGIGACFGLKEFEEFHQKPWLEAFPDRRVQDLTALIAEGNYSAAPGWAGVKATHRGPYLECSATGRQIKINGLDWWKRDGELYVENWVFVDMIHLFRQFGIDLLARIESPAR